MQDSRVYIDKLEKALENSWGFAEWCSKEGWDYNPNWSDWTNPAFSSRSTAELYELYLKENNIK